MQIRKTILILFLFLPCSVYAVDGIYVGLGGGAASFKDTGFAEATPFKVGVGSKIWKHFAFEVSYLSMGTFEAEDSLVAEVGDETGESFDSIEVEITGADFSLFGVIPVNRRVSLLGRGGLYFWGSETVFNAGSVRFVAEDNGSDASLGFGVDVAYNWHTSFTFMYDRYKAFDEDVEFLNAGIKFIF